MLNTAKLNALLQTTAYTSLSDAAAAALASTTTPTPRAGTITWATLASIWADATGLTSKAVIAFGALNAAVAAGNAANASSQAVAIAGQAAFAVATLNAGFSPQDPASAPFVATLGAFLVSATASAANPILPSDIIAVTSQAVYPCGSPVQTSDVTTARQIIAANAGLAAVNALIAAGNNRVQALRQTYAAAIAANPATALAPTLAQLAAAFGGN